MNKKRCSNCGETKSLIEFYKDKTAKDNLTSNCKSCRKKEGLKYYNDNKEHAKEIVKKYVKENQEKVKNYKHQYYIGNIDVIKEKRSSDEYKKRARKWKKEKYHNDPIYKFTTNQRNRIKENINNLSVSSLALLGCSGEYAYNYLIDMGYNNKIDDVDHIVPISRFNLDLEEHRLIAFNYKNLQPLESSLNYQKYNKLLDGWKDTIRFICEDLDIDSEEIISQVNT